MSQRQFDQANLAAAAGSDSAVARTVSSPKQSNQAALAVALPQNIVTAIQNGLNQQAQTIAQTLSITPTPAPPFAPDQQLTAGLNQSLTGLNLDLLNVLGGVLLSTLRTLLGDPNLSVLPINVSMAWTVTGGAPNVPLQNQVQFGATTAPTFDLDFRPQIKEKTQGNPDFLQFNVGAAVTLSVQVGGQAITALPINLNLPVSIPTLPLSQITDALKAALAQISTAFRKGLSIVLPPSPTSSVIRRPATAANIPSPVIGNDPVPVAPDKKLTAKLSKPTTGLTLDPTDVLNELLLDGLKSLLGTSQINPLAVGVAINWSVSGGQLSGRLLPDQNQARVQGPSNAPTFDVVFLPQLIKQTKTNPDSVQFTIAVSLTLSVKLLDQTIAVPPIALNVPIELPTLPIPVLLGLFRHTSFAIKDGNKQGFLLLVVPANSPFNVLAESNAVQLIKDELTELKEVATTLDRVLGLLSSIAGIALPSGLDKLVEVVRTIAGFAVNGINVTTDTAISNLNKIKMIDNPFFFKFNDIEAQNEISSLILIGAADSHTELFRRKEFKTTGGQLNVSTGAALVALISNLHQKNPSAAPASAKATVPNPNDLDIELWSNKHFGDSISSLRVTFS